MELRKSYLIPQTSSYIQTGLLHTTGNFKLQPLESLVDFIASVEDLICEAAFTCEAASTDIIIALVDKNCGQTTEAQPYANMLANLLPHT